ncbi:MAG: hypothetical protein VSS75_004650 [Candidatus Parabeggiatoa sp.]|nr:hypothetical protein [Candidatus Parabeggiatoa sp.]
MMDDSNFATCSPNSLLTNMTFWVKHGWFIVILLVSMMAFYYLVPLTYPKSDGLLAHLSIVIHILALWGIGLAITVLTKIQVEQAFATYMKNETEVKLRGIKSGEKSRISLEKLEEQLPSNPTPKLAMPRLFQHIIDEARDHRFESSVITMQPYREESIGNILKLQKLQKIALQLGILGTFIGLILALSQLSLDSAILEQKSLIDSLHISFSCIIAGLEVVAILEFLIMVALQKQDAYFQTMESATDAMISLAQNAINEDHFLTGFKQVENAINQLNDQVVDQTKEIGLQTNEMRQGMFRLAESKAQFNLFLDNIQQSQQHFVKEMMAVYDIFSPETISHQLQQSLEKAVDQISNTFNEKLEPSLDKITAMNLSIREVHNVLQTLENKLKEQNKQLEQVNKELSLAGSTLYSSTQPLLTAQTEFIESAVTQLEKGNQELTQTKTEFYGSLQPLIASQTDTFDNFQRDVKVMSEGVTSLNCELQKSNEVLQDLVQFMTSRKPLYKIIFEKLKMFYQRFK